MRFDIPKGKAIETLRQAALQGEIQILFSDSVVEGVVTQAVRGDYTPQEALGLMLAGTNIRITQANTNGAFAVTMADDDGDASAGDDATSTTQSQLGRKSETDMNEQKKNWLARIMGGLAVTLLPTTPAAAQQGGSEEEIYELSPFTVEAQEDTGYQATSTLAGTRINTRLDDISTTISVVTEEFMRDTGATDAGDLLVYTAGTEVAGTGGNFTGYDQLGGTAGDDLNINRHGQTNRVRGLAQADIARNYFITGIPFDSYNTSRVEINRGSNAVLFGLGSPAGIINNATQQALFKESNEVGATVDSFGSLRGQFNINRVVLEDRLALRVAGLASEEKFEQDPAFKETNRLYVAGTYKDNFFGEGGVLGRTTIRGNVEYGEIDSNLPRTTPPIDMITPWFQPHSTDVFAGVNMMAKPVWDASTGSLYNSGEIAYYASGDPIPSGVDAVSHNPALSLVPNTAYLGAPGLIFESVNNVFPSSPYGDHVGAQGAINGFYTNKYTDVEGNDLRTGTETSYRFLQPTGFRDALLAWTGTEANPGPIGYGNFYFTPVVTDQSLFDFRNTLIDGPNKSETQDFRASNLVLEQMLLEGKAGIEIAFSDETYEQSTNTLFRGRIGNGLAIDVTRILPDGTENPNFGRPVLTAGFGGLDYSTTTRENARATAFYDLDFSERDGPARWFGRHVVTAMASEYELGDTFVDTARAWQDGMHFGNGPNPIQTGERGVSSIHYLGGSLADRSSASGANIPGIQANQISNNGKFANGSDLFLYPNRGEVDGVTYAREFQTRSFSIDDTYPTSGTARVEEVDSEAFILQSYFLGGNLVGTATWRKDKARQGSLAATKVNERAAIDSASLNPGLVELGDTIENDNATWGAVLKMPSKWLQGNLISGFQVHYGESSNFSPSGLRVDTFQRPIPFPTGDNKEYGFTLSMFDNKLSARATWYETSQLYDNDVVGNRNWVPRFGASLIRNSFNASEEAINGEIDDPRYLGYVPGTQNVRFDADLDGNEDFIIPAPPEYWRELYSMDYTAGEGWSYDNNLSTNFVNVASTLSEGFEFEMIYNPTRNWRIMFNAYQQKASSSGGGQDLFAFFNEVPFWDTDLDGTPDLPYIEGATTLYKDAQWSHANPINTYGRLAGNFFTNWISTVYSPSGVRTAELAEWSSNFITNYTFTEGKFSGFRVGGALRFREAQVIGYELGLDGLGNIASDPNRPLYGDDYLRAEAWVGYNTALANGKIDWDIQLNIRNLFADDSLIPIQANPDGTVVSYRIPEPIKFELRNTFSF